MSDSEQRQSPSVDQREEFITNAFEFYKVDAFTTKYAVHYINLLKPFSLKMIPLHHSSLSLIHFAVPNIQIC